MNQKSLDKNKTKKLIMDKGRGSCSSAKSLGNHSANVHPKELEWAEEYRKLLKEYQVNAEDWDCFPDLGVKFINDLLTQQRTELLEEYFEKEDDLIVKYANLKDDNWDKFLEARSKLKINLLNKKDD